jgi:hypothetical protein
MDYYFLHATFNARIRLASPFKELGTAAKLHLKIWSLAHISLKIIANFKPIVCIFFLEIRPLKALSPNLLLENILL